MTATFAITRDQAFTAAMQVCQALGQGETPSAQDITDITVYAQALLKQWDTKGYNTWLYSTFNFPSAGAKAIYGISESGPDVTNVRPIRIAQAYYRGASGNDIPMTPLSRQEYEMLSLKAAVGPPNSWYYDRQLTVGNFQPWPLIADNSITFYLVAQRPISDLVANPSATFDIEQEWYLPLIWNIALHIMSIYGTEENQCRRIEKFAAQFLDEAANFTEEQSSVYFQPNPQGGLRRGRG